MDDLDIRIKAAELAAQCVQGQVAGGSVARRMASLVVFFETYINEGMNEAERQMHLLAPRKVKNLKVVADSAFLADGQ